MCDDGETLFSISVAELFNLSSTGDLMPLVVSACHPYTYNKRTKYYAHEQT